MKRNMKYLMIIGLVYFFTGCTSMSTPSVKSNTEVFTDKQSSYITFSRTPSFVGSAIPCAVSEFNYDTKEVNLVGVLFSGERIVQKVQPGIHYYYLSGGENDDYIKVQTEGGHLYYVNTYIAMGVMTGRTYFDPLHQTSHTPQEIDQITLVEPNEDAYDYFRNNKQDILSEIMEDFPEWSQEEYKEKQILPQNGFPIN